MHTLCVLECLKEALLLSSLQSELDQRKVPLYGILHEELGATEFKDYLKGELFLDKDVRGAPSKHLRLLDTFLSFVIRKCSMDQRRQEWEYLVSALVS